MNEKSSNQERFKTYLRKIGSGEQTSQSLTREESADALELMLKEEPSQIQIGAFMIAHRIRRPEPQELAGMIDSYLKLGPKIYSGNSSHLPICFGMPFDGRKTTSPIYPLTTLLLLNSSQPIVIQGAGRLPVKYGITTKELFQSLGLDLSHLTMKQIQEGFSEHGLAFIFQPDHFPLADCLIKYREDIGKRPPVASMELMWSAHQDEHLLISGFVHPPTEKRHIKTLKILGEKNFILINGLEGGIDIPTSRISKATRVMNEATEELKINPREYSFNEKETQFENLQKWSVQSYAALEGKGPLYKPLIWNAGVYFWLAGITQNISQGIEKAAVRINSGSVIKTLHQLITWRKQQL